MEKPTTYPAKTVDKSKIISLEKGKIPPQAIDLQALRNPTKHCLFGQSENSKTQ